MIDYTAEKDQIKYFVQNYLGKSHSPMCKLLLGFLAAATNYVYSSLWNLAKDFFKLQGLEMRYTMNDRHIR